MKREEASARNCAFITSDGSHCSGLAEGEGTLCYWHDDGADKGGPDVKTALEEWAATGKSMEGFVLRGARLDGVRLSNPEQGYDLRRANLLRASLCGARLFNINLEGSDLLKADLSGANLNQAKLRDANLLGAVFDGASLEQVEWGDGLAQEVKGDVAEKSGNTAEARDLFQEAEEIYRNLSRAYDSAGLSEAAGDFFQKRMIMRRRLMPTWSWARAWSKIVDLCSGYGENPERVVASSFSLILLCASAYFIIGVEGPDHHIQFDYHASFSENATNFLNCIYFSVVTFTTLGYGDITPRGLAEALSALEAFTGAFMMALFVAVFSKKMTR